MGGFVWYVSMAKKIAILEDNAERAAAMQRCLQDRFYQFEVLFFHDAAAMCKFCEEHLDEIIVIGLDHDLDLIPGPKGRWLYPGPGREVADYLAGKKPVCPVIIHTSNAVAADGMEMALQDAHWETHRIVPADDLDWIPTTWFRTIRRAIVRQTAAAASPTPQLPLLTDQPPTPLTTPLSPLTTHP